MSLRRTQNETQKNDGTGAGFYRFDRSSRLRRLLQTTRQRMPKCRKAERDLRRLIAGLQKAYFRTNDKKTLGVRSFYEEGWMDALSLRI